MASGGYLGPFSGGPSAFEAMQSYCDAALPGQLPPETSLSRQQAEVSAAANTQVVEPSAAVTAADVPKSDVKTRADESKSGGVAVREASTEKEQKKVAKRGRSFAPSGNHYHYRMVECFSQFCVTCSEQRSTIKWISCVFC